MTRGAEGLAPAAYSQRFLFNGISPAIHSPETVKSSVPELRLSNGTRDLPTTQTRTGLADSIVFVRV